MLARFAAFELRYQLFSPVVVLLGIVFFLFAFGATTSEFIRIGSTGAVNVNSPTALGMKVLILSVFGIFFPAVFLSSVVLRDAHFRTEGMFYSRPVRPLDYLLGRFLGAYVVTVAAFAVVPLGIFLGSLMPWLDPDTVGPQRPLDYLYAVGVLAAPNLLITGAILFTVANLTRSTLATYTALVAFLMVYLTGLTLLDEPEQRTLMSLIDPFGLIAWGEATRYWPVFELNDRLVPLEGLFLWNRVIWVGVGLALVALNTVLFSFRARTSSRGRNRGAAERSSLTSAPGEAALPTLAPRFNAGTTRAQFLACVRYELIGMIRSVTFWVLLALGMFNSLAALVDLQVLYGTPAYPVSRLMITVLQGAFSLVPIVIVVYFAPELVWRDRGLRAHEIVEATPTPSWVFVLSKLISMWAMLAALFGVAILTAVAVQLGKGYTTLELGLYARRLLFQDIWSFYLIATLSIFVQVLTNNRYVGMLVMVVYIVASQVLPNLGFEHNLYMFAGRPAAPMSDMNGDGHFIEGAYWFNFYWSLFSGILLLLTFALWSRGSLTPILKRLAAAPTRLGLAGNAALALLFAGFVATGVFIFYNTNILNEHMTTKDVEKRAAAYERAYRQYEDLPQPRITDVKVDVDIFPRERRYEARGSYVIENKTGAPIDVIHVGYGFGTIIRSQTLEGGAIETADEHMRHYVWRLAAPMQPGERRTLAFEVARENPGFRNQDNTSSVVWNGAFVNNFESMPWIGYSSGQILEDRQARRRQGLEPVDRMPKLEDETAWGVNYLRGDADWVTFETTVSTSPDQIVIAPGYLEREWEEGGRRYFHYKMDTPILNFFSYLSARYDVVEELEEDGLALQVFYNKAHAYNVPRMIEGMRESIAAFSEAFGPFQHRQMRIFEFPGFHGSFAQSFPNSVPYSESIGFIADNRDPEDIDYVYYVTAHEVAHQWWAHQVMGADTQGATLLSETFSQYSALLLMEREYGEHHIRRFLKYELDNYLSSRGGEEVEELPLYRVENQPYIHYRKGSVVMYALKDYLGEETVNRALARLISEHAYKSDPYPRSVDFLRILREEAGPEHETLITDLFEKIVLFDMKVTDVAVTERADGRFDVRITADARKLEADGEGAETEVPLDYMVDIGLFTEHPDDVTEGSDHVIFFEKRPVHAGENVYELTVDRAPRVAGIDPYNKLVDRNSDDNLRRVGAARTAEEGAGTE